MEQNLRQILGATINSDTRLRNEAERQLELIGKSPEMMYAIQTVLMKDSDVTMRRISSIYFANALKKNWGEPAMAQFVLSVREQIVGLLAVEDAGALRCYQNVLQHIFESCELKDVEDLSRKLVYYFNSQHRAENVAALNFVEGVLKSEKLRYNLETVYAIVFNENGPAFARLFSSALAGKDYAVAKSCMKILARAYSYYSIPDFLNDLAVFDGFFKTALGVLKIEPLEEEAVLKLRKWACFFLYKSSNRAYKKYFKNPDFSTHVQRDENTNAVVHGFCDIVERHAAGQTFHPRALVHVCEFFTLLAQTQATKPIIKSCYGFLISKFILPAQSYDSSLEDAFEYNEEKYLRGRYNYVISDLRASTASLFSAILHVGKAIRAEAVNTLLQLLKDTSVPEYSRYRYGIVGLLAGEQKSMTKTIEMSGLVMFISEVVVPDLSSERPFLISQALYFLHNSDDVDLDQTAVVTLMKRILELMESENEIISVEALLATSCFLNGRLSAEAANGLVPRLIQKTIQYSKQYYLESLNNLMDLIINNYTEAVASFAPQFAESLSNSIMENLRSSDDSRLATVCGFINAIDSLIANADDQTGIVQAVFEHSKKFIYTIFADKISDFYQEALGLMNSFLFILEAVSDDMLVIFGQALEMDREDLSYYPREISDFIDNFLSYGKERIINAETLRQIYGTVDAFVASENIEDDLYEEDFECACRVCDSLMLNAGARVHALNANIIPCIVHKMIVNYEQASKTSYLDALALETIMNCFLIAPQAVLGTLGSFSTVFFNDVATKHAKFTRVHDKKIFILFIGALFSTAAFGTINIEQLNDAFVEVFYSLPEAIKKRNKLREKEDEDEGYESDEADNYDTDDDDEYDDDCDTLYEDIWFETDLDKFDAYGYVREMLMAPVSKSIGELAISKMTQPQIAKINEILNVPQEAQK
ncbi:importin-7 [Pancytospora philotis]|nr:importin-7 [Pancytospora philotis]